MKANKLLVSCVLGLALVSCNNNGGNQSQDGAPVAQEQAVAQPVPDSTQAQPQAASAQAQTLPEAVTTFLQKYFPGATVSRVETDTDMGGQEYDVMLSDGTEVDFDSSNQWESIDSHTKAVPAALVPSSVASYVKGNYASLFITKIDKKHTGYEIELSNGTELKFDGNGNFMGLDD